MHDPAQNKFVPIPDNPTPTQRNWTRFEVGEIVQVKGIPMRVHDVGETRLVLKLDKQ